MNKKYFERALRIYKSTICSKRKLVGVRLLKDKEDYCKSKAKPLKYPVPYCVLVKLASHGYARKMNLETCKCEGASRALGLEKPKEIFKNGDEGVSMGLYKNKSVASKMASQMSFITEKEVYGYEIYPVMECEATSLPDVLICITNNYNAMRLIQGYAYEKGEYIKVNMAGNQALCSEITASSIIKNGVNISFGCSGTRYLAGWKENEVFIGFSLKEFIEVMNGVLKSVEGTETSTNKERIVNSLKENDLEYEFITKDGAYFIDEYKKG